MLDFDRAVFTRRRRVARHVLHPRSGYCDRAVLTRTGRARRSPGKKKESLPGEAGEDHSLERRAIGPRKLRCTSPKFRQLPESVPTAIGPVEKDVFANSRVHGSRNEPCLAPRCRGSVAGVLSVEGGWVLGLGLRVWGFRALRLRS